MRALPVSQTPSLLFASIPTVTAAIKKFCGAHKVWLLLARDSFRFHGLAFEIVVLYWLKWEVRHVKVLLPCRTMN